MILDDETDCIVSYKRWYEQNSMYFSTNLVVITVYWHTLRWFGRLTTFSHYVLQFAPKKSSKVLKLWLFSRFLCIKIRSKSNQKWLVTTWVNSHWHTSQLSTVGQVLVPLTAPVLFHWNRSNEVHSLRIHWCVFFWQLQKCHLC